MMGGKPKGLRKLSADLIDKARDDTAAQVTRITLTFVGTVAFCWLSLFSPDSGLVASSERLTVPGVGPVSFSGFMVLGPTILIVLRAYLQIYVEHTDRLDRIAQRMPVVRAPTLVPLKNPLIRGLSGFILYLLLPVVMLFFAWKAAVFPAWGSGLLCIAAGVVASHAMLPLRRLSWRTRTLLSAIALLVAGGLISSFGPLRRPFELSRVNLSNALLQSYDFRDAEMEQADLQDAALWQANLENARLDLANLRGALAGFTNLRNAVLMAANLRDADLTKADLTHAFVNGADLRGAILVGATLSGANLSNANLSGADLRNAILDGQPQLDMACGTDAKLPPSLTLKPCVPTWSVVNPLKGFLSGVSE